MDYSLLVQSILVFTDNNYTRQNIVFVHAL